MNPIEQRDEYFFIQALRLQSLCRQSKTFQQKLSENQLQDIIFLCDRVPSGQYEKEGAIPSNWVNKHSNALTAATELQAFLPQYRARTASTATSSAGSSTSHTISHKQTPATQSEMSSSVPGSSGIPLPTPVPAMSTITLTDAQFQTLLGSINNARPSPPAEVRQHTSSETFKAQDLGFFDPNDEAKAHETVDNKTVYHNVFSFTRRVKAKVQVSGVWSNENIAAKLDQCLRGKAEVWYTSEISATTRAGLRTGVDLWCTELETRFRESPGAALSRLERLKYSVYDARNRRDPEDFVQSIVVNSLSAGMATTEAAQILTAYQHLAAELRITIPVPTATTTLTDFIKQLTAMKSNWFDIYASKTFPSTQSFPFVRNTRPFESRQFSGNRDSSGRFGPAREKGNEVKAEGNADRQELKSSNPQSYQQQRGTAQQQPRPFHQSSWKPFQKTTDVQKKLPFRHKAYHAREGEQLDASQEAGSESDEENMLDQQNDKAEDNIEVADGYNAGWYQGIQDDSEPEEAPQVNLAVPSDIRDTGRSIQSRSLQVPNSRIWREIKNPKGEALVDRFLHSKSNPGHQPNISNREYKCKICNTGFPSGNQLHAHLKTHKSSSSYPGLAPQAKPVKPQPHQKPMKDMMPSHLPPPSETPMLQVVSSTASPSSNPPGYAFRGRRYAQLYISIDSPHNEKQLVCLDTGCGMSLIDATFLKQYAPTVQVSTMETPMTVQGIGATMYNANKFIKLQIYIFGENNLVARIEREIHVVDNLKANILLGMDIADPEGWLIDLSAHKMTLPHNANMMVPIIVKSKEQQSSLPVYAKKRVEVPPHSRKLIPISGKRGTDLPLLSGRDFLYEPAQNADSKYTTFAQLVDHTCSAILVQNEFAFPVAISENALIGHITDDDFNDMFLAEEQEVYHLAAVAAKREAKSTLASKGVLAAAAALKENSHELSLSNGVTIQGSAKERKSLQALVDQFKDVWEDRKGFAIPPNGQKLKIPLVDDWEIKYKPTRARIYPVNSADQKAIDEVFDKLHAQGRLAWTIEPTPFSFPCFVLWKVHNGIRKARVVVDIRALNHITLHDAYPIPLQTDIINAIANCQYISVLDCASFFYQWPTATSDQHRLTVISHRGQETFLCPAMGFRNSVQYVQRIMDLLLKPLTHFVRAYIDDIVVFSRSFASHLDHLQQVLAIVRKQNIHISAKKTFLSYPSVQLLGQKVDALGLATDTEKLKAISSLQFPVNLTQLEHYLGLTGYLRHYIRGYAMMSAPLQDRKSALYRLLRSQEVVAGPKRQRLAARTIIENPSKTELKAFKDLQQLFASPKMLHHADKERILYVDVDASKDGIGAVAYHSTIDPPTPKTMQPVLFLSRRLKAAEINYWPTEMEIAGLCWIVSKLKHLIEAARYPTIIFTDHGAAIQIATQTSMTTTSLVRMNTRHLRSSEFLSRFRITVKHKPGKENIVADALSRLPINCSLPEPMPMMGPVSKQKLLKDATVAARRHPTGENAPVVAVAVENPAEVQESYPITTAQVSAEFLNEIRTAYATDKMCQRIIEILKENQSRGANNAAELPFKIKNGLILAKADRIHQMDRPVIPKSLVGNILDSAHDAQGHPGYARLTQSISENFYVFDISKVIRTYLWHCRLCQVMQTPRHKPYGSLQPILTPPYLFHTITIDFILALPTTPEGYNCTLTVVEKLSKAVTLIPGKKDWDGAKWGQALIDRLLLLLWGMPSAIISDRDPKFTGQVWQTIFTSLKTKTLFSTAWHPQTDGSTERMNQHVEIAFRYFIAGLDDISQWASLIPRMCNAIANATARSSGIAATEMLFGQRVRNPIDAVADSLIDISDGYDLADMAANEPQEAFPIEAVNTMGTRPSVLGAIDALKLAALTMKIYYDKKHQPMFFAPGQFVLLRLHRGYMIPGLKDRNKKIEQQFAGPFKVLERVGRLAYRIELPPSMKIHPVISIAQLEKAPDFAKDPFNRNSNLRMPRVGNTEEPEEVEKILRQRLVRKGSGESVEYLIRYKGLTVEYDRWITFRDVPMAMRLEFERNIRSS